MASYVILNDDDVDRHLNMNDAVGVMERAFIAQARGHLVAPPRFKVSAGNGSLVFTAGAVTGVNAVIGFRAYDTFESSAPVHDRPQLVAAFDGDTGALRGLVIGSLLGAVRTGAIGGVALKYLSRADARTLAIIGAGFQARQQVRAALSVRRINSVYVYSRTNATADDFARWIEASFGVTVTVVASADEAVQSADIIICATNSPTPVLRREHIRPGVHISTIGPMELTR